MQLGNGPGDGLQGCLIVLGQNSSVFLALVEKRISLLLSSEMHLEMVHPLRDCTLPRSEPAEGDRGAGVKCSLPACGMAPARRGCSC